MSQEADTANAKQYFEQDLPAAFVALVASNPPTDMQGEEYRLTYEVAGEKYGLVVRDGTKLEVVPGGANEPHLHITLNAASLESIQAVGLTPADPLVNYNQRKKFDKIKTYKGLFRLELAHDDGSVGQSATVFNGVSEPSVTLKAKADDYAAIVSGKMNGQLAMMTGKVKFEGSLPFLMQLSSLN